MTTNDFYRVEVCGAGGIRVRVVADSIAGSSRLTSLELRYHRFIHSEFMTHRVFSRNASSSRAIPVRKMLEQVRDNPATPIHWGKNKPGMQADEELLNADVLWHNYANHAATNARILADMGYHKQIVNRLLEPFQFINVICTATEWQNFFDLRLHKDAQPEIQELARCMKEAMDQSTPSQLYTNDYHLPYVTQDDLANIDLEFDDLRKCSVARCARVSYMNHDNTEPDIAKDIALHDTLLKAGHMSPFEHVATPLKDPNEWSGNFKGWWQYRKMIGGI